MNVEKVDKVVEINELLRIYGALLTKRQHSVLARRYGADLSFGEIATEDGITRQAVLNFEKKAIRSLNQYERKMGVWARERQIKALLKSAVLNEHARSALTEVFT